MISRIKADLRTLEWTDEHTPTPWFHDRVDGDSYSHISSKPGEGGDIATAWVTGEANAAFIVKAVNSHDALVTELKLIADWRNVSLAGEYEHSLRDVIRSMLDCADRALATLKDRA